MDRRTAQRCLQLLADADGVGCLDITGGAPELNSQFRCAWLSCVCMHGKHASKHRSMHVETESKPAQSVACRSDCCSRLVLPPLPPLPKRAGLQRRHLVAEASQLGVPQIIDRCNLTVLCEPGQEDLPAFLAQHGVRVVASLPCYGPDNVDKQRGRGVFERSIEVRAPACRRAAKKQREGERGAAAAACGMCHPCMRART